MTTPIFSGTINGRPVRFYLSPESPFDAPWPAHNDLAAALGFCEHNADRVLANTVRAMPDHVSNVEDDGNFVAIISHEAATLNCVAAQWCPDKTRTEYRVAIMRAYYIALQSLPSGYGAAILSFARLPEAKPLLIERNGEDVGGLLIELAWGGRA